MSGVLQLRHLPINSCGQRCPCLCENFKTRSIQEDSQLQLVAYWFHRQWSTDCTLVELLVGLTKGFLPTESHSIAHSDKNSVLRIHMCATSLLLSNWDTCSASQLVQALAVVAVRSWSSDRKPNVMLEMQSISVTKILSEQIEMHSLTDNYNRG